MHSRHIPVAKEGLPFIGLAILGSITFSLLNWYIPALVFFVIATFITFFFRDPERIIPLDSDLILSPADGRVIEIVEDNKDSLHEKEVKRISIFMNIFNVHVNRAPITGDIQRISYKAGSFWPAQGRKALLENERNAILIHSDDGMELTVVQVAGIIARRIICWVEIGDRIKMGERFGLICFGSRLDVYIPKNIPVLIKKGDRTRAGQTVIARKIVSE
jgi:phosphatidylserine decarboxylase